MIALDPKHVVETAERLQRRVGERFPDSGLSKVAEAVAQTARVADEKSRKIARAHFPLRSAVWLLAVALLVGVGQALHGAKAAPGFTSVADMLQGAEAAVNIIILLGAGILSIAKLEENLRRKRALALVHELKGLAHVIDMHQLTKDPETVAGEGARTDSSPVRKMTRFELGRYLDYCSELLSMIGKIAALYGRRIQDPVVLEAVDDAEALAANLSGRVWQNIAILSEARPKT